MPVMRFKGLFWGLLAATVAVVAVAVVVLRYSSSSPNEGFATGVASRQCKVYYTNNMSKCDRGDYRFHRKYYEEALKDLKGQVKGVPSQAQAQRITELTDIIKDYDGLKAQGVRSATSCRVDLPNWIQATEGADFVPALGPIAENKDRGPASQWAYCFRTSADIKRFNESGMKYEAGFPQVPVGNQRLVRGAFEDKFAWDSVKKTYCSETKGTPKEKAFSIKNGLIVEADGKVKYISNGVQRAVNIHDINSRFNDRLYEQFTVNRNGKNVLLLRPKNATYFVHRLVYDPCDKLQVSESGQANVKFKDDIVLKEIPLAGSNAAFYGTIADMRANRSKAQSSYNAEIRAISAHQNRIGAINNRQRWIPWEIYWNSRWFWTVCRRR